MKNQESGLPKFHYLRNQKDKMIAFYFHTLSLGENIIDLPIEFELISAIVCENGKMMLILESRLDCKKKPKKIFYVDSFNTLEKYENYSVLAEIQIDHDFAYFAYME